MCRTGLIFSFLIGITYSVHAQFAVKNHLNLLPKKNSPLYCISEDNNGCLWVGSKDGILKFDGKNNKVFGIKEGLNAGKITCLFHAYDHSVWVGNEKGKVYHITKEDKIDSLIFNGEPPDSKITGFKQSNKNVLFISTYGSGIYVFENNKQIQHFNSDNGLSDNVVYSMQLINNELWCGTDAGISILQDLNTNPKIEVISSKNGLPDNIVRCISPFSADKLLIGTEDSGICLYNINKKEFERILFFTNWDKGPITNCLINKNGEIVFATSKKGLFLFKNGILHNEEFKSQLKATNFNALHVDHSNSIWLSSEVGLHQIIPRRFEFINSIAGIPDENILSVLCDNNNTIWAGTSKGLIEIFKNEENYFQFRKVKDFPEVTVSSSASHKNGALYFGTYESGLVVIKDKKIKIFNTRTSDLPNDNVSHITVTGDKIFISTLGAGLIVCKIEDDKLIVLNHYNEENGLVSNYVYCSILTKKGELYIASDGGLELLKDGKFELMNTKLKLKSNIIYSLCEDEYQNLWAVSNSDGVLKIAEKSVTAFGIENGLRDEQPAQIIAYEKTLYLLHPKGIDKLNINTGKVSYYDVLDGDLEPNLNSILINNGQMFSATNNGVLCYRLQQNAGDTLKPGVQISKFLINYKQSALDSAMVLDHSQKNLAFEFTGTWSRNPDKLNYRFKLAGYDEDWKTSTFSQLINYNNLNSGTYTFVVQCKNEEDIWSKEEQFSFRILKPIWEEPWFWVVSSITLIVSIYLLVKWRLKTLQKENQLLEEKVAQRTHEIEKQSEIIAAANKELEQLSIVASKTSNVVLILNPNGDIEYVNDAFERLNRITLKEILERKLNILTSSNNPRIADYVKDAIQNKRSVKYESLNEKDPANKVWEASTLTPIFDENNEIKKLIIIDSDITEAKHQQKIIEQKNKDITDSLEYARKIQTAILPSKSKIEKSLPHSFVFYKTKDIVSGDFYWFAEKESFCIIASVDCTGHGVPGAFMSLIGYNILNKIVNENNVTDPGQILKNLNLGVVDALHANQQNSDSKDGMDAAICKIYFNKNRVDYAGAMRPIWIVNGEQLTEIKADKIPIGTKQDETHPEIDYKTHQLTPDKDDVFYIFTDGYADQFGGEKGKKMGSARFKELLIKNHKLDFQTQGKILLDKHLEWKQENEQVDDLCVIGFKRS
ncbi:MAG: SpoIIE family protein phosphatase [Sphingobacteriaceae bacterium]|nr:SpoIIE family protein phosphatase [Sphingobacteriaceae bacterium]